MLWMKILLCLPLLSAMSLDSAMGNSQCVLCTVQVNRFIELFWMLNTIAHFVFLIPFVKNLKIFGSEKESLWCFPAGSLAFCEDSLAPENTYLVEHSLFFAAIRSCFPVHSVLTPDFVGSRLFSWVSTCWSWPSKPSRGGSMVADTHI
jgi:hypothetical protein